MHDAMPWGVHRVVFRVLIAVVRNSVSCVEAGGRTAQAFRLFSLNFMFHCNDPEFHYRAIFTSSRRLLPGPRSCASCLWRMVSRASLRISAVNLPGSSKLAEDASLDSRSKTNYRIKPSTPNKITTKQCHILRLPVELLELISDRAQFSDLCSFRQTCKTFAEIAFDDFASHYIGETCCFYPDPARVKRLYDITSQPHLAKHIRIVYLTLDPFEYKDGDINYVAPAHDRGNALADYKEIYKLKELEYYCSRRPDLSLVTRSLAHLNPLRNHLHVDIENRHYFYDHVEWAKISQQCLAAVAKAGFPIYDLTILSNTDIYKPYPNDHDNHELQKVERVADSLYCTALHFTPTDTVLSEFSDGRTSEVLPIIDTFPKTSEDAESLEMIFWHRIPSFGSRLTPFASTVLSRNHSTKLRRLTLVRVVLDDFEPLFQLLQQCRNALEAVLLHEVEIITEVSSLWWKLFESLITMPNLEHLNLRKLWLGRTRAPPLAILDPATQSAWSCHAIGHFSVRIALRDVIKNPPRYRSRSDNVLALW